MIGEFSAMRLGDLKGVKDLAYRFSHLIGHGRFSVRILRKHCNLRTAEHAISFRWVAP